MALVAPHGGQESDTASPLTEGRGLKCHAVFKATRNLRVAPHGGAWIEISLRAVWYRSHIVAPHGGAWIEMI